MATLARLEALLHRRKSAHAALEPSARTKKTTPQILDKIREDKMTTIFGRSE
jgi:hypothetical protein